MKNWLLPIFSLLSVVACQQRSPLSDVEVSDPGIISPVIKIERHIDERANEQSSISVYLNDDNGNSIELSKGSVALDGKTFDSRTNGLGTNPAPYYSLDHFNLEGNKTYSIRVTLADGKSYPCTIKSPKYLLTNLEVPEYYNVNKPIEIHWSGVKGDATTNYYLEVRGDQFEGQFQLSSAEASSGHYTFSSDDLHKFTQGKRGELEITLLAKTKGKVHSKFDGGSMVMLQSITKQMTVDEGDNPTDDVILDSNQQIVPETPPAANPAKKEEEKEDGTNWSLILLLLLGGGLVGFGVSWWMKR